VSLSLLDCLFTDESCELFDDDSVAPSDTENRLHVLLADGDHDEQPQSSPNDDDDNDGPAMTEAEIVAKGHQDASGSPGNPDQAGLKARKSVCDATKQLCFRQLQQQDASNLSRSEQGRHRH
jgi:hypothetical protein